MKKKKCEDEREREGKKRIKLDEHCSSKSKISTTRKMLFRLLNN